MGIPRRNKGRWVALIGVTLVLVLGITHAWAASQRASFNWYQTAGSTITLSASHNGSGQISFEAIATSVNPATFQVELQVPGFLGIGWKQVGTVYTVNQHNNWTTSARTGQPVQGQYFRLFWPSQGNTNIRFVLKNPTQPPRGVQTGFFTEVWY